MAKRTITFSLNPESIEAAIREIEQYKRDLLIAVQDLVYRLAAEGREYAVLDVLRLGAFDTGALADSIKWEKGYFDETTCIAIIKTDVYYAVFVEYGTGVVGAGESHPMPPAGWDYDHNQHGDKGWVYHSDRDDAFHWTRGQPANPFMYNTFRELTRIAQERWGGTTV